MKTRRQILRLAGRLAAGALLALAPAGRMIGGAWAAVKRRVLPRGTELQSLKNENPAALDTRRLPIMPLEQFETMGLSDHAVQMDSWRLEVTGKVATPLELTYEEVLGLPAVEREVLLICPGIFTIHARWKGVGIDALLKKAGVAADGTAVTVHGPSGPYEKVEGFSLEEIRRGGVFLAYAVNGERLPQKHGFPLRLVAPDRHGSDWVKYAYKVEVR